MAQVGPQHLQPGHLGEVGQLLEPEVVTTKRILGLRGAKALPACCEGSEGLLDLHLRQLRHVKTC